jgi:hypothetical protein
MESRCAPPSGGTARSSNFGVVAFQIVLGCETDRLFRAAVERGQLGEVEPSEAGGRRARVRSEFSRSPFSPPRRAKHPAPFASVIAVSVCACERGS